MRVGVEKIWIEYQSILHSPQPLLRIQMLHFSSSGAISSSNLCCDEVFWKQVEAHSKNELQYKSWS